jgi:hypothetical protein
MHAGVKPLEWLGSFCSSVSGALGTSITYTTKDSISPLVKWVTFQFSERLSGASFLLIWNLLQSWAVVNNCAPTGKVERDGLKMTVKMALKSRFGLDKVHHPLGDKR